MKREKQNNPVVVGVLLCILVGSVTKTLLDLRSQGEASPVVTQIANTQEAPVKLAAAPYRLPPRDPFFHVSLSRVSLPTSEGAPGEAASSWPDTPGQNGLATLGIAPLEGATHQTVSETVAAGKAQTTVAPGNEPDEKQPAPDEQERTLVQGLKLTAILRGQHPQAVLESPVFGLKTLRLGDTIETLRLTAIHAQEIVLEGEQGIWTLPLGSLAEKKNDFGEERIVSPSVTKEDANAPM
jgi:hypothetical protein